MDKTRHNPSKLLLDSLVKVVPLKESVVWANQLRLAPLDSLLWVACLVVHQRSDSLPKAVFLAVVHNSQLNLKAYLADNKAHYLVELKVASKELKLSLLLVALTNQ